MRCFAVVLLVVCFVLTFASAKTREEVCGSDSDCVTVKAGNGGVLKVDYLDFKTDKVEAIMKKLPSWFGKRPAALYRKGQRMDPKDSLSSWGLPIGAQVDLNEVPEGKQGDL